MSARIQRLFLALLFLGLLAMPAAAQTFSNLHSFTATTFTGHGNINSDGYAPQCELIISGNKVYGTAQDGGTNGSGTVFAVNTDGTGFTNLYTFTEIFDGRNGDGDDPSGGLVLLSNTLYGTTQVGGSAGGGTVFAVKTDGSGFTNLYNFGANATQQGGLILSSNVLYGTTEGNGSGGIGAVFKINTDGSGFTNLYSFTGGSDGSSPFATLTLSSNTLYGTTTSGGSGGNGTVFAVNTDGTDFTNIYSFPAADYYNSTLTISGKTLYVTTEFGGSFGNGAVFAVNTDGTGFTNLYSFSAGGYDSYDNNTNSDGGDLIGGLILSGHTLYGTTATGGINGGGTVFAINTDGTSFTVLYTFSAFDPDTGINSDGLEPEAALTLLGNTLYGAALSGGSSGNGTVFSLTLPSQAPQLAINLSGTNVVLTWPTSDTGYTLQSTTNLASPVWINVNGQNTVTNLISGAQMFYRLIRLAVPSDMALIPAGAFTMGDTLDGESDAIPTNITVSAFYMETNLVSYSQWQSVHNYATNNGYGFDDAGSGKAINHPVQTVTWYDTVKWCNARSQQAGLTPVYYTDAGMTQVYTNGDTDAVYPNWSANGYRLPTEAEWEKAARGGLSGMRFPLGNTISESQANYYGQAGFGGYDLGPSSWNATYNDGTKPYTSPVGSFAPNGYGLYDMAGNVWEWCWDWYGAPYGQPTTNNPTGPASGSSRIIRGGDWNDTAETLKCAGHNGVIPSSANYYIGFRCVIGL